MSRLNVKLLRQLGQRLLTLRRSVKRIAELNEFMERFGVEQACTDYGSTEAGCVANAPLGTAVAGRRAVAWYRMSMTRDG